MRDNMAKANISSLPQAMLTWGATKHPHRNETGLV